MPRPFILLSVLATVANVATAQDTVHVKAGAPAWGTNIGVSPAYVLGGGPDYRIRIFYGMSVDRSGRVYVFDLGQTHLDAYDAKGNFVRTLGGKGSGPGEYRVIGGSTVINDSILATYDFGLSRITLFKPNGELLRSLPQTRTGGGEVWFSIRSDTANLIYLHMGSRIPAAQQSTLAPEMRGKFLLIDAQGRIVDSIADPPLDELPRARNNSAAGVFTPQVYVIPTAIGGIVYGRGDAYRFVIQSADTWTISGSRAQSLTPQPTSTRPRAPHQSIRIVDVDWKPVSLAPEERAEWDELTAYQRQHDPKVEDYSAPKTKPAFKQLYVGNDGRVWVSLYVPATKRQLPPVTDPRLAAVPRRTWKQDVVFDVFDPMGKYLGRVTFPNGSQWAAAQGDMVWMQSVGPDDEHLVTGYKLTGIKK